MTRIQGAGQKCDTSLCSLCSFWRAEKIDIYSATVAGGGSERKKEKRKEKKRKNVT